MTVVSKIKQFIFCEKARHPHFPLNPQHNNKARFQQIKNRKTFIHDMRILSKYFRPWRLRIKSLVLQEVREDQHSIYIEDEIDITVERFQDLQLTEDPATKKRKKAFEALCLKVCNL
jgi:hypothetical protein